MACRARDVRIMIHRVENRRLHVFLCVFHSSPAAGPVKEEWINDSLHARKFAIFGGPEYNKDKPTPVTAVSSGGDTR